MLKALSSSHLLSQFALFPGQPIPDHNVVSRSVEDATSIGGGAEGDVALMRRERDHFFRSLKRSPSPARAQAARMQSGRDHFFRSLRTAASAAAASRDQTNHFFRALRSPSAADEETNHFFREENHHDVVTSHSRSNASVIVEKLPLRAQQHLSDINFCISYQNHMIQFASMGP